MASRVADLSGRLSARPWFRVVLALLGLAGLVLLVFAVRQIFTPFLIGLALAYLLDPVVSWMESKRIPRSVGIVLLFATLVLGVLLVGVYVVPRAQGAIATFADQMPSQFKDVQSRLGPYWQKIDAQYHDKIVLAQEKLKKGLEENLPRLLDPVQKAATRAFSSFVAFFVSLVAVISVPVFTFYLLKDIARVREICVDVVPPRYRATVVAHAKEMDEVISAFVKGQITVATILSGIYVVGLSIIGVPGAILVGLFCGYANMVPYLGIATGIPLASVLAFMEDKDFSSVVWVWVLFAAAQFVEGTIITPYVVGEKVGLHPVVMILALMIWGEILGFVGLLLAIPATAALTVLFRSWYRAYADSEFYRREAIHLHP